jgi:mannose-6-phosphate isomerase-like protein (cupin superfamily)
MLVVQPDQVDLIEVWSESDPTRGIRFGFAVSTINGAAHTAVAYSEVDPGKHTGMHTHSAEETHLILEGTAEIVVEDERERVEQGGVALAPAMALHDVYNVGSGTLRAISFFPSAAVVTTADIPVAPVGRRVFVTAPDE